MENFKKFLNEAKEEAAREEIKAVVHKVLEDEGGAAGLDPIKKELEKLEQLEKQNRRKPLTKKLIDSELGQHIREFSAPYYVPEKKRYRQLPTLLLYAVQKHAAVIDRYYFSRIEKNPTPLFRPVDTQNLFTANFKAKVILNLLSAAKETEQ